MARIYITKLRNYIRTREPSILTQFISNKNVYGAHWLLVDETITISRNPELYSYAKNNPYENIFGESIGDYNLRYNHGLTGRMFDIIGHRCPLSIMAKPGNYSYVGRKDGYTQTVKPTKLTEYS